MYLMDNIVETAALIRASGDREPLLQIYDQLERKLVGTPRFLFDEDATRTSVELTLGRPKVMLEAIQHCRIPYPRLWVEFPEWGRSRLRERFTGLISDERPLPARVGFLLECDDAGRAGHAVWAWSGLGEGEFANVAPFAPFFDLDAGPFDQGPHGLDGLLRGNLAKLWRDNPVQLEALKAIWRTAVHAPEGRWGEYYLRGLMERRGAEGVGMAIADVYGEYIQMWAMLLLLTSSRKVIELNKVDMSRLNRARVKRRQVARLDHTVVTMHLDPVMLAHQQRAPLGYVRKSPRVHLVSSYLGRRGDKHWIVQPYTRGSGETIARHVQVRR